MNDRFKFRFWNTEYNCYADTDFIPEYVVSDGDIVDLGLEIINGAIPEQCTGLKDKNGKLIYEGDIVKAITNTYKVIWDRYHWAIKDSQGYIFSEHINDLLYDCEIIGNIHEQAEQKE